MAEIYVKGERIGSCQDYLCECPEDAVWHRDLSDIFYMGVKAGLAAETENDIEVKDISEPW